MGDRPENRVVMSTERRPPAAVQRSLAEHDGEAVAESYWRRYQAPEPDDDDLLARLASFSMAACPPADEG